LIFCLLDGGALLGVPRLAIENAVGFSIRSIWHGPGRSASSASIFPVRFLANCTAHVHIQVRDCEKEIWQRMAVLPTLYIQIRKAINFALRNGNVSSGKNFSRWFIMYQHEWSHQMKEPLQPLFDFGWQTHCKYGRCMFHIS